MSHVEPEKLKEQFKNFDYNGNGILSLAEIDRALVESYPEYAHDKPAIMRAYKAADTSKDGFIDFKEFKHFLDLLKYYHDLSKEFAKLDVDHDKRVSYNEFLKGHNLVGIQITDDHAKEEFNKIDTNKGGYILFEEFCIYMAKKKAPLNKLLL